MWLQTCRTFINEGLEELRRQSLWCVGCYHEAILAMPIDSPLKVTMNNTSALLDPAAVHALTVCTWHDLLREYHRESSSVVLFRLNHMDVQFIYGLVHKLSTISKLRKLRLKVTLSSGRQRHANGWGNGQCSLDLNQLHRRLCHLQLETFELEVHASRRLCVDVENRIALWAAWTALNEPFAWEVQRLERVCVGAEATVTISSLPSVNGLLDNVLCTCDAKRSRG